ncbi:MFS general substrate transporter [Coprinellus micaceus]|uniref:MFS general substrate transporter n=1 Tax=Coprinellus micaceus TaxID=71717 RepID=A0A4Y7TDU9_COPMI|nr:MFS general substrate transporter [Coprinellus micaceus]
MADSEKHSIEQVERASTLKEAEQVTQSSEPVIDPVAERKFVRKLDWILLPLFIVIYGLNYIDRTAIGNAKVAGLEKDLGMEGTDLNKALTIFYVFYVLADIPSNLLLKRFGSKLIVVLVLGFGLVSLASTFITNYTGLIVTRIFLGIFEGGTLSGLIYVMSRYYRRRELVLRIGLFNGIAPALSGAFGGLIASALLRIGDFGYVKRWRKIFLIEGALTVAFGILLYFIMPDDPTTAKMLSEEERRLAMARIDADAVVKSHGQKEKTSWKLVGHSFNVVTIACIICFITFNMSFQGMSLFLPTVINTQGNYSTVEVQLRTVPPFLAGAVWVSLNSYFSYKIRMRSVPLISSVSIVVVGYIVSITTQDPKARYAACHLIVTGGCVAGPMIIAWATDNAAPDTMRATVSAAVCGIGALGSVIAMWTYLPGDAPDYRVGNSIVLGAVTCTLLVAIFLAFYVRWENGKRDRGGRDYRLDGMADDTTEKGRVALEEMGYKHPKFRYQI